MVQKLEPKAMKKLYIFKLHFFLFSYYLLLRRD